MLPRSSMKYFPTSPLEFAKPSGNRFDFDIRSKRGVSAPFAQTTTAFARCRCSCLRASKYSTPSTWPLWLIEILRTYEFARISQRPVLSATGITEARVLDLAPHSQPNISHHPQC